MANTSVLSIFRIFAPEFKEIEDDVVNVWIELTEPLVNRRRFGRLHSQALALLTAHRMKLAHSGVSTEDDPLASIGNIGLGNFLRVGSFKEGQTSISFNHDQTALCKESDAELALTEYGIQFLTLRRMRIVPIVSSAEPRGR